MNITGLIAILQETRAKHGDLEVYVWDDWYDFPFGQATVEEACPDIIPGDTMARPKRLILHSESGDA